MDVVFELEVLMPVFDLEAVRALLVFDLEAVLIFDLD